jgi:cytochrome c oxidase subunit IV
MVSNWKPKNFKLKVALAVILAGGLVWAELGQNARACLGVPDLGDRFVFVIVPYALLALGLLFLARSRADLIVLLVCAILVVTVNMELLGERDELGLICAFLPIEATLLVVAALVIVAIRRLVSRLIGRKVPSAAPVQNRLP